MSFRTIDNAMARRMVEPSASRGALIVGPLRRWLADYADAGYDMNLGVVTKTNSLWQHVL